MCDSLFRTFGKVWIIRIEYHGKVQQFKVHTYIFKRNQLFIVEQKPISCFWEREAVKSPAIVLPVDSCLWEKLAHTFMHPWPTTNILFFRIVNKHVRAFMKCCWYYKPRRKVPSLKLTSLEPSSDSEISLRTTAPLFATFALWKHQFPFAKSDQIPSLLQLPGHKVCPC